MFDKLRLSDTTVAAIDWDMTPDLAFCVFSAKGLREELVNTKERVCYFFIDNWGDEPKLYLMERGIRYVHYLAEVKAPKEMLINCIVGQGGTATSRDNFPLDDTLKEWVRVQVVESDACPLLVPAVARETVKEDMGVPLPRVGEIAFTGERVQLPTASEALKDEEIRPIIRQWNFYDALLHPQGRFDNALVDTGDGLTVLDRRTGILWQRTGLDLCSYRSMKIKIEELNREIYAGYSDWRIPALEEALSLMEPVANPKGVHLHPCFSKEQPFIFVAARRRPTGCWFVDYAQGKVYWSSRTVPGGFCRLCRKDD
ncbi:MAG: DUF1566 domain-containing protein [Candidatus Electrothrix sp. AR4]|nr:DUF1566 domain-containing protein [Candidatus Electrothrix sp. AR4]